MLTVATKRFEDDMRLWVEDAIKQESFIKNLKDHNEETENSESTENAKNTALGNMTPKNTNTIEYEAKKFKEQPCRVLI